MQTLSNFNGSDRSASQIVVDGLTPKQVEAPASIEELRAILDIANREKLAVIPFGSGSKQHVGKPVRRFDLAILMQQFGRILEYEPQDLVVKVESGCRLTDLQARLAQDGLFLPLDPPAFEQATLGGIVSANDSGPLRCSQGTVRDYLIGLGVVQPDGAWTKFGSRVVKNVTGYDMCKLYSGSFGTLGVLVDFFFKLKPLPPSEKTVIVKLREPAQVQPALRCLFRSSLSPLAVELLNPAALDRLNDALPLECLGGYALVVRFGDVEKAVQWQIEQLEQIWGSFVERGIVVSDATEQATLWRQLREDGPWLGENPDASVKLKLNCLPAQLSEIANILNGTGTALDAAGLFVKAHAANGVIRAYLIFDEEQPVPERFAEEVRRLRELLKPNRGTVLVERAPAALKQAVDVWGYDFKDLTIMRQIRQRFDQNSILNPGRFVV